ncbi:trypsin-like peptidase domain-containing protein [Streptomyces sp. NPDC050703]|uniref:trypsin-like peptidase domain-containing protein n=1 Tax=Streptomyces sp. NPDC050703 TaxID=3157218 RepID=UPI003439BBBB
MKGTGYWVDLYQAQQRLGGGFLLTRRFVLTALHCLRGLAIDESVGIELADGNRVSGRVCREDKEADLALVEIGAGHQVTLPIPTADVARDGDRWRGPYRPAAHEARLSGRVSAGSAPYLCVGGATIEALQLTAEQHLGDYSGYSGGPVEGVGNRGTQPPAVVGILIEQAPDRAAEARAANVLFAATIREAIRRFDHLDVVHLIDVLRPPSLDDHQEPASGPAHPDPRGDHPPAPTRDRGPEQPARASVTPARFVGTEALLLQLDAWAQRSLIDPSQIAELKFMAVKALIDGEGSGGGA